jgi:alanyl aminopeptidase
VTLLLAYDAPFGAPERGLFRVKTSDDQSYAFTQFAPSGARCAFPSFDEPAFKTPFDLTLVIPKGMQAFANTPEVEHRENPVETWMRFARTPPLPSYLIAFAVGDFDVDVAAESPVPIRLIRPKGKPGTVSLPLAMSGDLLKILADFFDYPYPFAKLDLLAIPHFRWASLESPGLLGIRESMLLLEGNGSVRERRELARSIAHALAHQWAGNLVTARWWNDVWLHEGLTEFASDHAIDAWQPAFTGHIEHLAWVQDTMEWDAAWAQEPVRTPVVSTREAESAMWRAETKGVVVLDMLDRWVGKETLLKGIRRYVRSHAWNNVSTSDFIASIEAASSRKVGALVSSFLDQVGVPELHLTPTCEGQQLVSLTVRQSPWRIGAGASERHQLWTIPFCMDTGVGKARLQVCQEISTETATVPIADRSVSCPQRIDPNSGLAGYYRYAVPSEQLEMGLQELARMDLPGKLGLLSNAWPMVERRSVQPDWILRLLPALDGEQNDLVLEMEAELLERLATLITDDVTERVFKGYVSARLAGTKAWLGLDRRAWPLMKEDDNRILARASVFRLGLLADDREIVDAAWRVIRPWLDNPEMRVDPDLSDRALPLVGANLDPETFDKLAARVEHPRRESDRKFAIRALSAVRDPVLLRKALELTLRLDLHPNDVYAVLSGAAERRDTRRLVFDWIGSEWERIRVRRESRPRWPVFTLIRLACDEADEKALAERFMSEPANDSVWLGRERQEAQRCRGLQRDASLAVSRYLAGLSGKK